MKRILFILLLFPFLAKAQITNITGPYQNIISTATSTSIGSGDSVYMKSGGRLTSISRADFTGTLGTFELLSNKSTDVNLGASNTLYPSQLAVKTYTDAIAASQTPKSPVDYGTAAALAANTYANGTLGVGATITMNATGTVTIDGHVTVLNEKILIKDESATLRNGIYTVTTAGAVGVAGVFTRRTDFDQVAEIVKGAFCLVINGTANASKVFTQNATVATVGTDPIVFVQTGGAGATTFAAITGNATDNTSLNTALNLRLLASSNLSDVASASTSRTNLGATTVGANIFTFTNPSAVRWLRLNADNTVTARTAAETLSDIGAQASGSYAASGANTDITSILLSQTGLVVKGATAVALTIKPNETYTTGRILNLILNDADRTINLSGNLTVPSATTVSGVNTGDQNSVSGNAGTASALLTAHTINGTAFDGTGDITVTAAAGTLTGATLNSTVTASSLTSFGASIALGTPASGTLTNCTFPTLNQNTTGTANVAGGSAGAIPYQSGVNATTVLAATATAGQMLRSGASAAPTWSTTTWPNTATTGDILVATGSSVIGVVAVNATANKMLLSGASAVPIWSTSTIPTSAGATANKVLLSDGTNYILSTPTFPNASATSGKTIRSDGTNWIASTATLSDAPSTAGKVLVSDGTNWITSTPTFPNASATSGKMIKSDGTNWIASTETYAAPGTSGNLLISDGTNWTSAARFPQQVATADIAATASATSTTTLFTPTADGMYRISIYMKITITGTSPVAGPVTITYTDADGSVAQSHVMLLQSVTGTVVTTTVNNSTTTGTVTGTMIVNAKSGVAIQYAIAVSGTFASGRYTAHLTCERVK